MRAQDRLSSAGLPEVAVTAMRLFEHSLDMLGTASADGYLTTLNPAWERTLGWTSEELKAEPYLSFVHPDDYDATVQAAVHHAQPGQQSIVEFTNRYRTRDGNYRCLEWTVLEADGVFHVVAKDVTERDNIRNTSQAILESMAEGLYVASPEGKLSFINPAAVRLLGYDDADELMGRSPHEAFHHTRPDGTHYPIDECPLLAVRSTGQPVTAHDDVFWRRDGTPLPVAYSSSPIELDSGRGSVVAFRDASLLQAERDRFSTQVQDVIWFDRVRQALDEDRFVLYGQPIIDLATGAVDKYELLLRMISPSGDIVAPGVFLPAAEKYGLINDIDRWVISEAIALAATGRRVAANLSAESMGRIEILLHIERELDRQGARAENLCFEVTETAFMEDLDAGRRFADRLAARGCTFALDDFGTGYGSLTYLRQLPVSEIKIDMQFVRDMAHSEPDQKLVQAIVHIANSLGKTTVAEGVEDQQTLDLLRDYGVTFAQGYHIGQPGPFALDAWEPGEARPEASPHPERQEPATPAGTSWPATTAPETADEAAEGRDVAASARDFAADARDEATESREGALLAAEESTLQALLAASKQARSRAAADRASARSDRQTAATEREHTTSDLPGPAAAAADESARRQDTAADERDVVADARDRVAVREEAALVAADESSGSTGQVVAALGQDARAQAKDDRAAAATDRQESATDREHDKP